MLLKRGCEGKSSFKDVGADGRIITKRIFKKWDESVKNGFIWLRIKANSGML
jgi:hypothetical protein